MTYNSSDYKDSYKVLIQHILNAFNSKLLNVRR